ARMQDSCAEEEPLPQCGYSLVSTTECRLQACAPFGSRATHEPEVPQRCCQSQLEIRVRLRRRPAQRPAQVVARDFEQQWVLAAFAVMQRMALRQSKKVGRVPAVHGLSLFRPL